MTTRKEPVEGLPLAVAETLSGERVAARLTFDQLAERSGIPARTLKYYIPERGRPEREMKLGIIERIAEALGIPFREVIDAALRRQARSRNVG